MELSVRRPFKQRSRRNEAVGSRARGSRLAHGKLCRCQDIAESLHTRMLLLNCCLCCWLGRKYTSGATRHGEMDGFACKERVQSVSMENDRVDKGGSIGLLTS